MASIFQNGKTTLMNNDPSWEQKISHLRDKYSPEEMTQLINGRNPIQAQTVKFNTPEVKKSGVGYAAKGLSVSPDSLEAGRSNPEYTDDYIADEMAKSSPHFATQLGKIRKKYNGDPTATSAFLNTRFYGDTKYNPVSKTTGSVEQAPKPKNYVAKTLDHIYQIGQGVSGHGGILQKYNTGEMNVGQAVARTAGSVAHGMTAPINDPLMDVTKYALDKTGGSQALQYGMEGVMNSEIGQQAAPYARDAIEWYNNLPEGSYMRDLAVGGQFAMDVAGVAGAQQGINMGKRAFTQATTNPWQTVRHPFKSAGSVWSGKPPSGPDGGGGGGGAGGVAAGQTRQLTGNARAAVKAGMDENVMTFAAEQHPDTRAVMAKMTRAANEGGKVLGGTVKHKEILGGQMRENAAYILEKKAVAGKALGAMKAAVADDLVNLTDEYASLLDELANKGAVIGANGKIVSLAGAADDNIPLLQKALDFFEPDDAGNVIKQGREIDMWRTKMFEEMNSAKAKLQPSANGQSTLGVAEGITNNLRRSSLVRMANGNKNMIAANDAYEALSTAASKYLKAVGYKGKLNVEAITAKDLKAGEVALRTLGNASAETRDAFLELIKTAKEFGRVSNIDEMALIKYADTLEDIFPITPTRSLQGNMSRATRDAFGNLTEDVLNQGAKSGLTRAAVDKVGEGIKFMRGITPENRYKLLMEVLEAPPDTPFFTVVQNALPENVADDLGKSSVAGVDAGDMQPTAQTLLQEQQGGASQGVKDAAKMDDLVKGGMTPQEAARSLNDPKVLPH